THKIAITAHRIQDITESSVVFKYKDYADGNKQKQMKLSHAEFLRRFEQHILPRRFVKIRHYGLLQNHGKIQRLNTIRKQLKLEPLPVKVKVPVSQRLLEKYGRDVTICPTCNKGKLVLYQHHLPGNNKLYSIETKPATTKTKFNIRSAALNNMRELK
ncbi:MAG: transposase, partial [Ferruginibacter sp.]